ncbi:Clp protease N-terminal domain-containing protein [Xylanimonas sp. McL0601]|uniref:Clp protease N-terminal domain-containing protein n=1 Tax=Xylanimonas sp. McL0601 TaxID=3414739 RepID=UPI003CF8EBC7
MFERFSKEARAAVIEAQFVARSVPTRSIDSRHVLVALAEADGGPGRSALDAAGVDAAALAQTLRRDLLGAGLDAGALAAVGIDLDEVRRTTDATFGEGSFDRASARGQNDRKHIPFTPDAKKSLELALREAVRLGSAGIDSGHLLLGILRGGSPAAKALQSALAQAGSDDAALRAAVERGRGAA